MIKNPNVTYPSDISKESVDLLSKLFKKDPKKRLGSKGANEVKTHPFFTGVDWEAIYYKKIKPPFMPKITKPDETRYIQNDFLKEKASDSIDHDISFEDDKFQNDDFSFKNEPLQKN